MENPKAKREVTIGLFLPDLEGRCEVIHAVEKAGYARREFLEAASFDAPALKACDLLVVSLDEWPVVQSLFQAGKEAAGHPAVSAIVCCPAGADLSAFSLGATAANLSFLPWPVDPRLLIVQIEALLWRRGIEADLRYRLKEREDVLQSISEVFFSVDHEFRYTFFNRKAEKVGGKSADEIIGKDMWETFPFLKNSEFHRQMQQAAVDRKILVSEYLGPITGGWFEMRIYPSAEGLSALFVDISARKAAEEGLRRAQEQLTEANSNLERAVEERTAQLHEANERLEELLYSIAHDLRSPLRSMQGFAQAFVDDFCPVLDDRAREYADRMTSAAVFMDRMLRDLIELSRVTKTAIHLEPVSVAEAWASALTQHEEKIKEVDAAIHTSPGLGSVMANRTLLVHVLANLLGNALKFTRKGVRPEIRIRTEPLPGDAVGICIEDNGIGIDSRYHKKVFRVFERLNGADYEGTGIGLAIAKKAVERMRGTLDFTSHPGTGTTFRLILPAHRHD
jgi:PAS domain S-box-containing protein